MILLSTYQSVFSKRSAYSGSETPGESEAELFSGSNAYGWITSCPLSFHFGVELASPGVSSVSPNEEKEQERFKLQLLWKESLLGPLMLD